MSRIVRLFATSLLLSVSAVSATALADDEAPRAGRSPSEAAASHKEGRDGRGGRNQGEKRFPMKSDAFKQIVEARIAHARARLDKVLDKHQVPVAVRAQIQKDFDAGAAAVRAAANRAALDGEVTRAEAKEVRELAQDLKRKAREKYRGGRG